MNHTVRTTRRVAFALSLIALAAVLRAADVRVYVQFAPGQKAAASAALAQANARTHHEFDDLNALSVSLPAQAQAGLSRNPNIVLLEEDPQRRLHSQIVPYGILDVQADVAVLNGATGAGIKIGVIDSGVLATHQDLAGVALSGEPDFGAGDQRTWYRDNDSHGTHVAGILAAVNNGVGVVGVSPLGAAGAAVHMVKVFGDTGQWVYSSDTLAAARVAFAKGARVINMSLGGIRKSRTEQLGFDALYNQGALLVAAAGNDGATNYEYPASYNSVISVGAVDDAMAVADFSQRNNQVELVAPGVAVASTVSYIDTTNVQVSGGPTIAARHVEFAARTTATAPLVFGGLATKPSAAWAGKVVLVDRGMNTFYQKVRNVQQSGGVACVIANNEPGDLFATLGTGNSSFIPVVSVSQTDGATLQSSIGTPTTVTTLRAQPVSGYDTFEGTSMATPHVAGVAALIWSERRGATNAQVRQALINSAFDLGAAGRDNDYGYGLVQANAARVALTALNPASPPSDLTPPAISGFAWQPINTKTGTFEVSWTTDEPATSDVQINSGIHADPDPAPATSHVRTFRGSRGATYYVYVISKDEFGNVASDGPHPISL